MATVLPNAGVLPPVPDSFDFDGWTTPPASKNPTGRTLRIRNRHNLTVERFNEDSIDQTLSCKEDRITFPDVGPALKVFYAYTAEDMTEMVLSEAYCTDVGPLPAFIRGEVERARRKRTERTEAEKVDNEKTKSRPLKGAMLLVKPILRIPGQRPEVVIPDVVLRSILHKLYLPMHWFSDERLQFIQHRLHDLPTKLFQPDNSLEGSNSSKVMVFDMLKMSQLENWGTDDLYSCMSPLAWQEASRNYEAAFAILSEEAPADDPTRHTFVSGFNKHRLFFLNYPKFEENYPDWYSFEREARHDIFRGLVFDSDYYTRQVDGLLHAKRAALNFSSRESSSRKRVFPDGELDSRDSKVPRKNNLSSSSFRADPPPPRGDPSSFRNNANTSPRSDTTGAYCIACDGSHRLRNHPPAATSFSDGTMCFTSLRDNELWTTKPFKGPSTKRICIQYNLPMGCNRAHESSTLHICSLCGQDHPAIPRNPGCGRHGRT